MSLLDMLGSLEFQINPVSLLNRTERSTCPRCGRHVRWYCCWCCETVGCPDFSKVQAPIPVTFLLYEGEKRPKSSAPGVAAVAENIDISVLRLGADGVSPRICDDSVLLYPDETALAVHDVDWSTVKRIYILDCTWNQVVRCTRTAALRRLRKVKISNQRTIFWRLHLQKDPHCLSSAESLYFLLRELHALGHITTNLDDLIVFFIATFCTVQRSIHDNGRSYLNSRHQEAYADVYSKWPAIACLLDARWGPLEGKPTAQKND